MSKNLGALSCGQIPKRNARRLTVPSQPRRWWRNSDCEGMVACHMRVCGKRSTSGGGANSGI